MPLNSGKWSRKRKIDHGDDWQSLYMHPQPTSRGSVGEACSSEVREAAGSGGTEGAGALQSSGAGDFSTAAAGRGEGGEDEGATGVAAGVKLDGGETGMNPLQDSSALLPDPAHLSHYKLVKLL